uniref:Uncharacterized protein n=1 Tax=Nothobranchius furzeri TaxID=105023 RepID=A0A8C6KL87_NOTFU
MEERTDSPIAVKVEGNSHSVILTYFQGDINSMVDAHFSRALSKACKPSEVTTKTKKVDKTVKTGSRSVHHHVLTVFRWSHPSWIAISHIAAQPAAQ